MAVFIDDQAIDEEDEGREDVEEAPEEEDSSLDGFICADGEDEEECLPPRSLFADDETSESEGRVLESALSDDRSSSNESDEPEELRHVFMDGTRLTLPQYISRSVLHPPDGFGAEVEVEARDLWRSCKARRKDAPPLAPDSPLPEDWFDDLQIATDKRGSLCLRSKRAVHAEKAVIRFPSGRELKVPVKRIVVEHCLFPYDEAVWKDPRNYSTAVSESSDEDIVIRAPSPECAEPGLILSSEPETVATATSAVVIPRRSRSRRPADPVTAIKTSKQKKRRQRRLELVRLKRDLEDEGATAPEFWTLSERRTQRQARMDALRRKTTTRVRAEAREAGYDFLLPDE